MSDGCASSRVNSVEGLQQQGNLRSSSTDRRLCMASLETNNFRLRSEESAVRPDHISRDMGSRKP